MIRLTTMTADHVAQVAALEKICFCDPWSENSVSSELKNPLSLWLVALDGETVVGYIGSQSVEREADMMNVAVHPDHRRRGIGETLVLALAQRLKEKGSIWGYDIPYLLTGVLNCHPSSAIRFTGDQRTDYSRFYQELLDHME